MRHFEIVNGIRGNPNKPWQWWDRATMWINLNLGSAKARAFDNRFPAVRTPKRKRMYAQAFRDTIQRYNTAGVVPDVMAHSNGNVITLMALSMDSNIMIDTLYMLFPACWSSFEKNGLNQFVATGQVKKVVFVGSKKDTVVKWGGRLTGWTNSFSPLGYGTLSYDGPRNVDARLYQHVKIVWKNDWGHNTFSQKDVFEPFLAELLRPEA